MTLAEKRAALEKDQTAKIIWIVLIILQAIGAVLLVLALLALTLLAGIFGGSAGGGLFAGFVIIAAALGIGLAALIFFGILRLEKWVVWLMWINVAISLPSLFTSGRNFYSGLLPILIAIGYTYVIRTVYPKTPVAPTPPAVPTPPVVK